MTSLLVEVVAVLLNAAAGMESCVRVTAWPPAQPAIKFQGSSCGQVTHVDASRWQGRAAARTYGSCGVPRW